MSQLTWNITGDDASLIVCLVARDMMGLYSLPLCVPVEVTQQVVMVSWLVR